MTRERHPDQWADIALFERLLAETGTLSDDHLDTALVAAVQKAFVVEQVHLAWFSAPSPSLAMFSSGSRVDRLFGPLIPLPDTTLLPGPLTAPRTMRTLRGDMVRAVALVEGDEQDTTEAPAVDLRLGWTDAGLYVELRLLLAGFVDMPRSQGAHRRERVLLDLQRSRSVVANVVQILRPMRRFAHQSRVERQRRRIEAWMTTTHTFELDDHPDLESCIQQACELAAQARTFLLLPEVPALDRDRVRTAVERVVRTVIHVVLSAGWRTEQRPAARHRRRESTVLSKLVKNLDDLPAAPPTEPTPDLNVTERIRLLRCILDAAATAADTHTGTVATILGDGSDSSLEDRELRLFAAWSIVHDLAHSEAHRRTSRAAVALEAWKQAVTVSRDWLPPILSSWASHQPHATTGGRNPFHAGAVRNWLNLWFAHHVLPHTPSARPSTREWRLRRSLAHVFRETLRAKLYSSSPGYRHRPDRLVLALQDLIDQHVRIDVRLDAAHDIRGHLALVGDAHHPRGPTFSTGHLEHVLELYIAGHFLLSSTLTGMPEAFGAAPTMAEVLANPTGGFLDPTKGRELLGVWSLAALYHDVGLSLFPEFRTPRDVVTRNHPSVAAGLEKVRDALAEGARGLAAQAHQDLLDAKLYDPTEEPRLHAWLVDQTTDPHPNHGLTGAWYLLCATSLIQDMPATIRHQAARAVLLHAAPSHEIDCAKDPAAAMLVFCDELFDWDPSGNQLFGVTRDRSGPAAPKTRAAAIRFPQLRVTVQADHTLSTTFDLGRTAVHLRTGAPAIWPRVELTHIHPEQLGGHVFPLWLAVAQNISRLSPGTSGFAPCIDIRGRIPAEVLRVQDSTTNLLDALLDSSATEWRPDILPWFNATLPEPIDALFSEPSPSGELRRVFPLGRAITQTDLRGYFEEMRGAALHILREDPT